MLCCHGALKRKKSLPNSRGRTGGGDINRINDADWLTESITALKYQRHEAVFACHMEDIRFQTAQRPRLRRGAGSFTWHGPCRHRNQRGLRDAVFENTEGLERRLIEIPHYRTCGSFFFFFFELLGGSFSSSADITAVEDVTGCVKVRTDSELAWWKLSSEAVIKWFAGWNTRLGEDAERPI